MSRTAILAPMDRSFLHEVAALSKEGGKLSEAYSLLAERMLLFAQDFKRLWDKAQKLDGVDNGEHQKHLKDALARVIETSDKSIRSRWIMIGSHAKKLINLKDNLPPYRDSLYEIALALEDEKPVTQWVKQKQITADSSFREIKSLRGPKKRRKQKTTKPPAPSRAVRRSFSATVTLSFETFNAAAEALQALLLSDTVDFKLSADRAFEHAIREKLQDDSDYKKAKSHFS